MNKITRRCECCGAGYAGGKDYGDYWAEYPDTTLPKKGLCEFCNKNCTKWYIPNRFCHSENE